MASISSSKDVSITFSDEEKEILAKAITLLKDLGIELWKDDCDEEGYFFTELGSGIENALKGHYWLP